MTSVYVQINLCLAASWILFQLLPKSRFDYRSIKRLAQALLISSLLVTPILVALPDVLFPKLSPTIKVFEGREEDTGALPTSHARNVLSGASTAIKSAPGTFSFFSSAGLWIFLLGLAAISGRRLWQHRQIAKLLGDALILHRIRRTSVAVSDAVAVPFFGGARPTRIRGFAIGACAAPTGSSNRASPRSRTPSSTRSGVRAIYGMVDLCLLSQPRHLSMAQNNIAIARIGLRRSAHQPDGNF